MVTREELFVSISPQVYRRAKSNTLMSQADLLSTLKRLNNLSILARQKRDLKIKLYKLFASVSSEMDSLKDKLPTPAIPKTVHKKEEVKPKESFARRDDIEEELRLIQQKLRELNSL